MGPIIPGIQDRALDDWTSVIDQFSAIFAAIFSFVMDNWIFSIFIVVPVVGALIAWIVSFFNGRK